MAVYDLVIIGAGPAGQSAANAAAARGVSIALVERDRLGGTCHNYGCDPTKTLLHSAHLLHEAQRAQRFGLRIAHAEADWADVQRWVRQVLEQMQGGSQDDARRNLEQQGIDVIFGQAAFTSAHDLSVGGRTISAKQIILAPGTQADVPPIAGLADVGYITNVEAVGLASLPKRLAIIGSGPIGIEFAQMFARFGVQVTVLERAPVLLDGEDRELADALCGLLNDEGIRLETGVELQRVERTAAGKMLVFQRGEGAEEQVVVDEIMVAAGRKPAFEGLQLERAGVETHKRGVVVDATLRTSVPHIWAVGDIATRYQFTHVAEAQATLAVQNAFSEQPQPFDDRVIPWVVYTSPELAHVGQTEQELAEAGTAYTVVRAPFAENDRAIATGSTHGQVKLLVGAQGKLLGGHVLGERAGDIIAPVVLAMRAELTVEQLAQTILPYPTFAVAIKQAAEQYPGE
ncbi:MAG: FAD-dependent oxidoreductase [Roseiflexaceae bacterium]|nr:FAD-dependent oxidoreductase [Roseiflexaceae bacterium]